jgi:hypothetical protein
VKRALTLLAVMLGLTASLGAMFVSVAAVSRASSCATFTEDDTDAGGPTFTFDLSACDLSGGWALHLTTFYLETADSSVYSLLPPPYTYMIGPTDPSDFGQPFTWSVTDESGGTSFGSGSGTSGSAPASFDPTGGVTENTIATVQHWIVFRGIPLTVGFLFIGLVLMALFRTARNLKDSWNDFQ